MTALLLAVALATSAAAQQAAPPRVLPGQADTALTSPDGRIAVGFGRNASSQPVYTMAVAGRPVIAPSVLGLEFERYKHLSDGLQVTRVDRRQGRDIYTLVSGKTSRVNEAYNEVTLHLAEPGADGRRLDVIARAYDSGIAIRYRIPVQPHLSSLRVVNELTQFAFSGDFKCVGLNLGTFRTSHEGEFDPVDASLIRPINLYDLPMTCDTGGGGPTIMVAEADVDDWPVMYLTGLETGKLGVSALLSRRIDDPAVSVERKVDADVLTPWRIVMVAADAGHLVENNLVTSLNPAPTGDFGWVRPGKYSWDWWSGPVLAEVPTAGTNDATERAFIDFAASLHLAYHMIDDGWYVHSGDGAFLDPGADPTRTIDAIHLPDLVRYAGDKGVGLIVWVHWKLLDRDMERILAQIERWGVKGIKVDFMNRDDQEMVNFYHRLAAATARHHLLLDLHGATHPWGLARTWPNFLTQEGVLGAEYNKWTQRITAHHNITLPYTRGVIGPMDYTPGAYRNRTPDSFVYTPTAPQVQTTRAAELAKYVLFDSGLQAVADSPDAYRGEPGLDFLAQVPASWDETRFVQGTLGNDVAVARRKGQTWYVGAMTTTGGTIALPLGFLSDGRYFARLWLDGATPTDLDTKTMTVERGGALSLRTASAGGAVAVLTPMK